ncbi:periplasmic copper chaperone A [Frankia sp. AiPs1]|uniref:copper chaperone PCu(A)C n=1 Tax=Frankia sp. AiPa1 TaxID=573492 RepID=UPI00202AEEA0|nr:copper chaperone PCu(A)C [Frankia sp. AiPa1]MCL9758240.1 copper chaperone PCu(A)C [Frankia sp. AiPa1]
MPSQTHHARRRQHPHPRLFAVSAVAAATLLGAAACGSSESAESGGPSAGARPTAAASAPAGAVPPSPAGTASADLGELRIRGAYIPQQASDTDAAAYFSVTNTGDAADTLTSITTPAAPTVSLHTTVSKGGAESMQMISRLAVPAHGTAALTVGHDHAMLENPVHRLAKGQRVPLTLTFAHAGTVTLAVPVLGYTGPSGHDTTGHDMTGMDMTATPAA